MRLAVFGLAALATVAFAGSASAQHNHGVYAPRPGVGVTVVTPGGFSFGYSNARPYYPAPIYRAPYYGAVAPRPLYYYPGHYDYHRGHYHYHPGHYHTSPYHRH